jgi:iron(III) transport system ATP-binding protein
MSQPAFVTVSNVSKSYGAIRAVDGVSLSVGEGHTMALLGPSGCGKTTVLRCLAGLETPETGAIAIAGCTVFDADTGTAVSPEKRGIGIVFQSYAIWPHMTVAQNVGFPLKVRKVSVSEQADRVARVLDIVGLRAFADSPATQLSGGQQQRVALARALVYEPRLMLFDEPMSNLDAQMRDQVRVELKTLQDRLGFTAIYVTHDQAEAFALAENVVLMNRGRIETQGAPRDVSFRPRTPFVARFLGLNVRDGRALRIGDVSVGLCYAEVALSERTTVRGLIGDERPMAAGAPVVLCVRKEHVAVRKLAPGEAVASGAMSGEVAAASFLGLEEEYVVRVDGFDLRSVQMPLGIAAGDRVAVTLRPEDCTVFLAEG